MSVREAHDGAPAVLRAAELLAVVVVAWCAAAVVFLAGVIAAVAVELFSAGWGWVR